MKDRMGSAIEKAPLRIGFVIQSLSSGTLKYARDLVAGSAPLGVNMVTVALDAVDYHLDGSVSSYSLRFPFASIGRKSYGRLLLEVIRLPIALPRLIRITIGEKIDLLYTNNLDEGAIVCCLVAFFLRRPVVLHVHDLTERELYVYERGFARSYIPILAALARIRHRLVSIFNPHIIVASEFVRKQLLLSISNPIVVIPHGIVRQRSNSDKENQHRELRLISIGKIEVKKRFDLQIKAMSLLRDINVNLVIVGEGPLRAQLTDLAKQLGVDDRVRVSGFLDEGALNREVSQADVGIVSSLWEGFGYTVLEMMNAGLPVIASDGGALPEIIRPGENGYLFPVNDYIRLAEIVRNLHDDRVLVKKLHDGALATLDTYTMEKMMKKTHKEIRTMVLGRKS